ncbi:MAG: hypothetical protein M1158_04085 [Candidatus Marsarchaeota archaeon]|jgi:hypothetical protein|nr:hypothetical protein [Candidatus Marsarchaeota archaeon]
MEKEDKELLEKIDKIGNILIENQKISIKNIGVNTFLLTTAILLSVSSISISIIKGITMFYIYVLVIISIAASGIISYLHLILLNKNLKQKKKNANLPPSNPV